MASDGSLKKVLTIAGGYIDVDTSDETCMKFGFKSGDKFCFKTEDKTENGVIVGVAPLPIKGSFPGIDEGKPVLWVQFDGQHVVSFIPRPFLERLKKV